MALKTEQIPIYQSCQALGMPRSSFYRSQQPEKAAKRQNKTSSARALSEAEREAVRQLLNSERFCDQSPREVYATLLDEGVYLCSIRTMYRILAAAQQVKERRKQRRHVQYKKPELLAEAPNQVWSWDISK